MCLNNKRGWLLLMIPLLILVTDCKKNGDLIQIEGLVRDPNTAVNVEGALVVLSAKKVTGGVYSAGFEEMDRITTGADGKFNFSFGEEYISEYRFSVSKAGYFSVAEDVMATDIKAGEVYQANLDFYPIGYVDLKVRNFAPFDTADFISYWFSAGYLNGYECCDNSILYGHGENFTDTIRCKTYGNQDVTVTWIVTKNQVPTQHSATFFCAAFDTVSYQINY